MSFAGHRASSQRDTIVDLGSSALSGDAARREASAPLSTFKGEFSSIGVQLGTCYDGSNIVAEDSPPLIDDHFEYRPTTIPGGRLLHAWLGADRKLGDPLFDRLSVCFTVLRVGDDAPNARPFEAAARDRNIPLTVYRSRHRQYDKPLRKAVNPYPSGPTCCLARRRDTGQRRPRARNGGWRIAGLDCIASELNKVRSVVRSCTDTSGDWRHRAAPHTQRA